MELDGGMMSISMQCYDLDIPHIWTFVPYDTNWRYRVCNWCSSHVLVLRMPLVLKMVNDKEYPRVHRNRQHVLAFICLVEEIFFKSPGYLPVVLVYGHKLDHGGFH